MLGIFYRARRHVVHGEPDALKGFLLLAAAVEEIQAGRCVVWIDFEMSAGELYERLTQMGLTDEQITDGFLYFDHPGERLVDAAIVADVVRLVAERQPSLVVVDSTIAIMALHGLHPDSAIDVENLYRDHIAAFEGSGACVAVLDHVVKSAESRGRWATGSERKLGVVAVVLGLEVITPFGRGRTGQIKVLAFKDRPGFHVRPKAAEVTFTSDPATGRITWRVAVTDGDAAQEEAAPWRPTFLMERVSRYVEAAAKPVSITSVVENVQGNDPAKRAGIEVLLAEGYFAQEEGPRNARLLHSLRPYREIEDGERP